MRTTITVTYNSRGISRLTKDIRELRGELKKIDGKYVFFVDAFQPGKAAASKPMNAVARLKRTTLSAPSSKTPALLAASSKRCQERREG